MIEPWRKTPGYIKFYQRAASITNVNTDIRDHDVVLASFKDPDTGTTSTEWIKIGWRSLKQQELDKEEEEKELVKELFDDPEP